MRNRPYFSIVIPCYNSNPYYLKFLLESIVDNGESFDLEDIEVIIVDDCSTDLQYFATVEEFKDKLNIKITNTEYNCCPGNTRQAGVDIATGEWLCFADHDDKFMKRAFSTVKNMIITKDEKYLVSSSFYRIDQTDETIGITNHNNSWNHGKFYNMDNLWNAYEIRFKKDLISHEDIYISTLVNAIMDKINRKPLAIDVATYSWRKHNESLSNQKFKTNNSQHSFLETFFGDYIEATANVIFDLWDRNKIGYHYAMTNEISIIAYIYFYMQSFIFHDPQRFIKDNIDLARKQLVRFKESFGFTNQVVWNVLANNDAAEYKSIEKSASIAAGPYIPFFTLSQWLDYLHTDIQIRKGVMYDRIENS